MSNYPERISHVCTHNNKLNTLTKRAQQLKQLNTFFQSALPTEFKAQCYLVNITDNALIVHTDNPACASLLRFYANTLCQALSEHLPHTVYKLDVKVRPLFTETPPIKLPPRTLPSKAADTLQQTAQFLEQGTLKSALEKLAKRSKKPIKP